jgi:hypothetical protein
MNEQSIPICVETTSSGHIEIKQASNDRAGVILVTADQVEQLIAGLKEAKREIQTQAEPAQSIVNPDALGAAGILPAP